MTLSKLSGIRSKTLEAYAAVASARGKSESRRMVVVV